MAKLLTPDSNLLCRVKTRGLPTAPPDLQRIERPAPAVEWPSRRLQWKDMTTKARVYVSLKPTVLDPQGQTIHSALNGLGHKGITSVRQGKYFEIEMQSAGHADTADDAAKELDRIARDVLSNPVMENYRVELLD